MNDMKITSLRRLSQTALLAAVYAALTMCLSFMSYGPVQFRLAEALCALPFLFPWTSWGLVLGCLLSNLLSAYGPADIVFGTGATLLACLATAAIGRGGNRRSWLRILAGCMMPVVCNAVIVGAVISWAETDLFATGAFWPAFAFNAVSVGAGELTVMLLLGVPLLRWLPESGLMRRFSAA